MIEYEYLREILDYDAEEGAFYWAASRGYKKKGTKASSDRITIDCKVYEAGKLAWLYTYGRWPGKNFRHLNGDKSDIRFSNLTNQKKYKYKKKRKKPEQTRVLKRGLRFHVVYFPKEGGTIDLGVYKDHRVAKKVKELCST